MSHVFLSYSHHDSHIMVQIAKTLRRHEVEIWTDERLKSSDREAWQSLIEIAIEKALCVVGIFSPNAKNSDWMKKELRYAKAHEIYIVRVLVEGDERNSIPLDFIDMQYTDLRGKQYDIGILSLINEIRRLSDLPLLMELKGERKQNTIKTLPIKDDWNRTGALFWIGYDLQWTFEVLMNNVEPAERINRGLRQCFHHASRIDLGNGLAEQLRDLRDKGSQYINDGDWTPQRRGEFAYEIRDIFNRTAKLAEENENQKTRDGFDAGNG